MLRCANAECPNVSTQLASNGLCPECVLIAEKISERPYLRPKSDYREAGGPGSDLEDCTRSGCVCAACDTKTSKLHKMIANLVARDGSRGECHFHNRCAVLWERFARWHSE